MEKSRRDSLEREFLRKATPKLLNLGGSKNFNFRKGHQADGGRDGRADALLGGKRRWRARERAGGCQSVVDAGCIFPAVSGSKMPLALHFTRVPHRRTSAPGHRPFRLHRPYNRIPVFPPSATPEPQSQHASQCANTPVRQSPRHVPELPPSLPLAGTPQPALSSSTTNLNPPPEQRGYCSCHAWRLRCSIPRPLATGVPGEAGRGPPLCAVGRGTCRGVCDDAFRPMPPLLSCFLSPSGRFSACRLHTVLLYYPACRIASHASYRTTTTEHRIASIRPPIHRRSPAPCGIMRPSKSPGETVSIDRDEGEGGQAGGHRAPLIRQIFGSSS